VLLGRSNLFLLLQVTVAEVITDGGAETLEEFLDSDE
jgi:hypothetical protein